MAGLWERVRPDVDDRVNIHLIEAAYGAYLINTATAGAKGTTKAQILSAVNSELVTPLSAAEQTDLDLIADEIDAQSNLTNKLLYLAGLKYVFVAAEEGLVTETKWRQDLGI